MFLKYIKNIGRRKNQRGGHQPATRLEGAPYPPGRALRPCGPLGRPPTPIFCYMMCFDLEKIKRKLSGRSATASRRNLGRTNLGLRRSCSAGETSLRVGEIEAIVITNDRLHQEGVNINQHLHQHHLLSNPSSSLVSDLSLKTSDWYLWVASSVDILLVVDASWFIRWKIICSDPS